MSGMYKAPKLYEDTNIESKINMYHMAPIYDTQNDVIPGLAERQDKCLADLTALQARLSKLETECSSKQSTGITKKLDIVIGCTVGSPAVNLAVLLATFANCAIKVYSHSSNKRQVDSNLTNKLLKINAGQYVGVIVIYRDCPVPYFMCAPGKQIPVCGLSNILRYVVRDNGLSHLYDESDLAQAGQIDEVLALLDQLELGSQDLGQLFNKLSEMLKSSDYLAGNQFSIADMALCCSLMALDKASVPNALQAYFDKCCTNVSPLSVLKSL